MRIATNRPDRLDGRVASLLATICNISEVEIVADPAAASSINRRGAIGVRQVRAMLELSFNRRAECRTPDFVRSMCTGRGRASCRGGRHRGRTSGLSRWAAVRTRSRLLRRSCRKCSLRGICCQFGNLSTELHNEMKPHFGRSCTMAQHLRYPPITGPPTPAGGMRFRRGNDAAELDRPDQVAEAAGGDRPGRGQPAANRRHCAGRGRAHSAGSGRTITPVRSAEFSESVFNPIRHSRSELVILAGFLSLLRIPPDYQGRVINVHPSLIPAFCGKGYYGSKVHKAVVESGVKVSGCTVHFVDDSYDKARSSSSARCRSSKTTPPNPWPRACSRKNARPCRKRSSCLPKAARNPWAEGRGAALREKPQLTATSTVVRHVTEEADPAP